nr:PREDICTED: cathepsin B-like [Bemisia tabaci]
MESLKMWTLMPILFLMLLTSSFGMDSISELLRTHPTWSFELRSVESLVQDGMKQLRNAHAEFDIPEDMLRRKIESYVRPGETHVVFKTGDPKWPERVPQSFDARDHFKECAHLIGDIEDEGPCYNDVHVTVASVATDRYCIYTNGTFKGRLSSEYLTGCYSLCTNFQTIYHTWDQVVEFGLPSGGKYSSNEITHTSMVEFNDLYHLQHNDPCLPIKEHSTEGEKKRANNLCKKLVETYLTSRMYKRERSSCKDAEFFGCERDDTEAYETHRCTVQFKTTGMWPFSSIGSHKKLLLCVAKDAEWYAKTQQEYGASHGLTEVPRGKPSIIRDQSLASGRNGRGRSMDRTYSRMNTGKSDRRPNSRDRLTWCQTLLSGRNYGTFS